MSKSKEEQLELRLNAQDTAGLKSLMQDNYLRYASYVILDRAIPDVIDGLKPVQRRILHTLKNIDDGKLHKVANVVGQTMAYHPHGDAAIGEALVNMANKDYLLDRQGNFGNLYTGDSNAAVRYIETRLSPLARETLFNKELTEFIDSYDGRSQEPIRFPAKIPVVLMHGAEGIAVGMSTRILPHNFVELLEAEIAILEGKKFEIYPDFPTGGTMDVSEYDKGRGKVKLRARLDIDDDKTIVIREICYGTTTESLIRSIDEAAKRGKIKIDSINDYTAEKVEIEVVLPRGQHAKEIVEQLYGFTDCEVSLNSQVLVIRDNFPWETDVDEVLKLHADKLKGYLKREMELEREHLLNKIYQKTLEQIFIENRLYKKIETVKKQEDLHSTIEASLKPFKLSRKPVAEDFDRLLAIPIRRISRFDIDKNQQEIAALETRIAEIEKHLKSVKRYTINYLKGLIKTHGKDHPRLTKVSEIKQVDMRAIKTKKLKVGYDPKSGFLGTKVSAEGAISCTNFDKILLLFDDGSYRVTNVPEKLYINDGKELLFVGVADKETIFRAIYKDPKTGSAYAKRFQVAKFIVDRDYDYLPEGMKLEFLTTDKNVRVLVEFKPKARQKQTKLEFALDEVAIKGVKAKGVRINHKPVKRIRTLKR